MRRPGALPSVPAWLLALPLAGLVVSLAACGGSGPRGAETVHAAVAANFAVPFSEIAAAFEHETGIEVEVSRGSTGQLYAQILHGAPFDVLLAADAERPARLEAAGRTVPGSRFTYARGRLALWRPAGGDPRAALLAGDFRHLAMANPKTAPYGEAARQVLARLAMLESLEGRIVLGEDVGQTYQFVATGNADLGFVARSQLAEPEVSAVARTVAQTEARTGPGTEPEPGTGLESRSDEVWWVPESLHDPIEQQAVLLRDGQSREPGGEPSGAGSDRPEPRREAARALLEFLGGPEARRVLERHGYLPGDAYRPSEQDLLGMAGGQGGGGTGGQRTPADAPAGGPRGGPSAGTAGGTAGQPAAARGGD